MASISLNTIEVDKSFFTGTTLFAVAAAGCPDYRFSWLLNQALGLDFSRNPTLDILTIEKERKQKKTASLFDIEENGTPEIFYFSVFQHRILLSESSIFIYKNRIENKYLIPEFKQADYFILLPYDAPFQPDELQLVLNQLPAVQWLRKMDVHALKSKRNFIF